MRQEIADLLALRGIANGQAADGIAVVALLQRNESTAAGVDHGRLESEIDRFRSTGRAKRFR